MTFKETLTLAKQHNISVIDLDVAYELYCQAYEKNLNDNDFEKMCHTIKRAYFKSEYITVAAITEALLEMINNGISIDNIDTWELIDRASYKS